MSIRLSAGRNGRIVSCCVDVAASMLAAFFLTVTATSSFSQTMALPGSFAVGTSGAATYNIPIAMPPGTAGMAPSLSLEYGSQSGNGMLGVGWSLGGLPAIGRCPRTMAQDGAIGGVNYDGNDRFCLDGQRLVAIAGTYGADGSEYRTEIDSYSKILSHGTAGNGPAWFEMRAKSGQVMEFGHTGDSQILAQGKTTARSWALNKVSDSKANYFTVTWVNDSANGQAYPSRVDYTGNAAASLATFNSVQFAYETRPDISPQYQAGSLMQATVRLTDVKTYANGALVGDYKLVYQQSQTSSVSEIQSISICGSDGACLPATKFTWASGGAAMFSGVGGGNPNNWNFGGSLPPGTNYIQFWGDFNGDGKSDFALVNGLDYYVFLSNGDGTFSGVGGGNPNGWNFGGGAPSTNYTPFSGDFNGDGKGDFALVNGLDYYVFLSNGDGAFSGVGSVNPNGWNFGGGAPNTNYTPFGGDFNGDGRSDFALVNGLDYYVFLSNGDGTFSGVSGVNPNGWNFGGGAPSTNYTPFSGDFNGDGRSDFALVNGLNYYVFLSNGDGTFSGVTGVNPNGWNFGGGAPSTNYTPFSGDFNGDAKSDFALVNGLNYYVFLSKGDGTFAGAGGVNPNGWNFGGGAPSTNYMPFFGDFNGDGKSDFALVNGVDYYVFLGNNGFVGDMITSITNGVGATTTVSYVPATNRSVVTKGTGTAFPTLDLTRPIYVVSGVATTNGVSGNHNYSYAYSGGRIDTRGRGFLGFEQTSVTDLQTNIVQTTTYHQDFPYLGLLGSTTKTLSTQMLNQTTNSYQFSNASGTTSIGPTSAPYKVSVSQSVAQSSDLDGSAMPTSTTTFQYDAFGNPTQVVASTPDGFSKTTANTYSNDTANWYLGRLTRAAVTSQAP
jgi:hypothetical protein